MQRIPQPVNDINIIVNINTEGKQRIINFESQLLFVNNMSYHITLVFRLRKLCSHASKSKSPTKKAATLNKQAEKPQQLQSMPPNNQKARQSSTLKMKQKMVKFDTNTQQHSDSEDGDMSKAGRSQKAAEKPASMNPDRSSSIDGLG